MTAKRDFVTNNYYHIFNRGANKQNVFFDVTDLHRFLEGIYFSNSIKSYGGIYDIKRLPEKFKRFLKDEPLIEITCYCLNDNHFHIQMKQLVDNGISIFMQRLMGGYTKHINKRYHRTDSLFGSKYKSVEMKNNDQLLYTSAYINMNNFKHASDLYESSLEEYVGTQGSNLFKCKKDIILNQFKSKNEYKKYCEDVLKFMLEP